MTRILRCVDTGDGKEWRYETQGEKKEDGPPIDAVKFTAENYPDGTTIQLREPQ